MSEPNHSSLQTATAPEKGGLTCEAVSASAPSMVGNVCVGFDVLGHTIAGPRDTVIARRAKGGTVRLLRITGQHADALDAASPTNTALLAAQQVISEYAPGIGLELELSKQIPVAAGMGGSAASAIAAVAAVNALLELELNVHQQAACALAAEQTASGGSNWDNIYPGLLGGLVLVVNGENPAALVIQPPGDWHCVLVHPQLKVETHASRAQLPAQLALPVATEHSANLAAFLLACERGNEADVRRFFSDRIAEPTRATQVQGFAVVKGAALQAGALGASLSGSGPSVFAWCPNRALAEEVAHSMCSSWQRLGIGQQHWIGPIGSEAVEVRSY